MVKLLFPKFIFLKITVFEITLVNFFLFVQPEIFRPFEIHNLLLAQQDSKFTNR